MSARVWPGAVGVCVVQAKVLNCLRGAAGGLVLHAEMAEYVWGLTQPERPMNNVSIAVMRLRRRGFPIITEKGRGYRYVPELASQNDSPFVPSNCYFYSSG